MILIATPLVLLRSEQSIALGVRWFKRYGTESESDLNPLSVRGIAVFSLAIAVAGLSAAAMAENLLIESTAWVLFGRSLLIGWVCLSVGFAITAALAGSVKDDSIAKVGALVLLLGMLTTVGVVAASGAGWIAVLGVGLGVGIVMVAAIAPTKGVAAVLSTGVGAVWVAGFVLGIWLRATSIRFMATACNILPGVTRFATIWRYSVLVSDFWQTPELMPGLGTFPFGKHLSFGQYKKGGRGEDAEDWIIDFAISVIFYTPAMLWRWSIKSTAWFYLPLLWVRRGWLKLEGEELRIWAQSYSSKAWNWIWLIFGALALAALAVTLFSLEQWLDLRRSTEEAGASMTVLWLLLSLNWSEILTQPWLWFYIPSYLLTIIVFFKLDGIAKEIRVGGAALESRKKQIENLKWAANLRSVLANIGLALALLFFLDAVDAWQQIKDLVPMVL
ncbi:MAG: hypothetical protein ACFB01_11820 [Cohaesibacteraceae bacterium]